MNIYEKKQRWKLYLFLGAVIIGVSSMLYTNKLVRDLSERERQSIELWAKATESLGSSFSDGSDLNFILFVIENNTMVPVILTDSSSRIKEWRNIDSVKAVNNSAYVKHQLEKMREENDSIVINIPFTGDMNYIFYRDSLLLRRLQYFPLVQLLVIVLFILVSYFAFSSSRKAEQNKVWVGLSKETAHQLGTPTSSLNGWLEILKQGNNTEFALKELEKDINRLEKITERFSKIGSKPILERTDVNLVLKNSVNYLVSRSSDKVKYSLKLPEEEMLVPINESLFEWVIENVCKNAMDAMDGKGEIEISLHDNTQIIYIDIKDNGRGIQKSRFKTIFKPGYTTKQRGWGLGLSLSKRIVESYHEGKIFVLNSELNKGTSIRIVLQKA